MCNGLEDHIVDNIGWCDSGEDQITTSAELDANPAPPLCIVLPSENLSLSAITARYTLSSKCIEAKSLVTTYYDYCDNVMKYDVD